MCWIFLIRISAVYLSKLTQKNAFSLSLSPFTSHYPSWSISLLFALKIVIVAVVVIFGRCTARRSHVTIQQCAQRIKIHHILKGNTLNLKTSAGFGNDIVFVLFFFVLVSSLFFHTYSFSRDFVRPINSDISKM